MKKQHKQSGTLDYYSQTYANFVGSAFFTSTALNKLQEMSQYFPQIRTLSTPLIPKQAIGKKVMVRPAAFGRVWNWQRAKWKTFVQTGGWVGKVCSCGQPVSHPAACQVHNFPRRFHKILVKQNINQNPADVCAYKRGLNHLKACNIIHPTPAPWSPTLSHTHTHTHAIGKESQEATKLNVSVSSNSTPNILPHNAHF